jgi:hypothetical protein
MKKLLLLCFIFITFVSIQNTFSQTVNDIPISQIKEKAEYCLIVGTSKILSSDVTIAIDFGQETSMWSNKTLLVKDENGKLMAFNSMIDALNFMSKNGYDFVNAYAITKGNQNVYHFLLHRRT